MVKRQNGIQIKYIVSSLLVLLITLITIICGGGVGGAYAAAVDYSGVMQDLEKDENFNPEDYPQKANDYGLQVIQIAESTDNKLFLYVYNPCGVTRPLIATCVNMSLTQSVDNTRLYNLTYLSSNGVFGKYLVNGVTVSEETTRYYNITSVFRKWIKGIDEETGNDNTINEVAFEVSKLYIAETVEGQVKYYFKTTEVVVVTDLYTGFIRYSDGLFSFGSACDGHYVAFSTDRQIDTLYEAYLTFEYCSVYVDSIGREHYSSDYKSEYALLTDRQVVDRTAKGLFGSDSHYKRIESVETFISKESLKNDVKEQVKKHKWVLRFYESAYEGGFTPEFTHVENVKILRLKFETNGNLFNLGVVSDGVTGSGSPSNSDVSMGFWEYLWYCLVCLFMGTGTLIDKIIGGVILFVCLILLPAVLTILSLTVPAFGAVMKAIFKGLWIGIKYFFIGLWYVISSPVRLIIWIVHKVRGE